MATVKKVVLAYSGGLDTSVIIPWLIENYHCEVIAFAADIGQGEELAPVRKKAIDSGASKIHVLDLREEFMRDFCFPLLQSGALYERRYMMGTSIARPLIAKAQVEVARKENADAVSHGATGKGNDQVRFELTYQALAPDLKIIAPWREWDIRSRADAVEYAKKHNIPVPVTVEKPYSMDRNMWHLSFEGGILEDPGSEPPKDMFILTKNPEDAPDQAQYVEIEFEKGTPVAVDGQRMGPVDLVMHLNEIAGKHGVGRVDLCENRLVGMKSRGVYETPGGTLLFEAHRELLSLTCDRDTLHYRNLLAERYAELVYNGQWFSPLRRSLDAFFRETEQYVTGTVRLKLYKGNCTIAGRKSPNSLYRHEYATFEQDEVYNQKDAEGFIKLFGLPTKIESFVRSIAK
ncbi:MAG: argininosuccinate synthase [Candidatus Omnitrophota bacterium]|jgi:argininosuccinate synthase|nr:MAG: argininosuccinate synthase [Candidatus Omnitrophota bacterium]